MKLVTQPRCYIEAIAFDGRNGRILEPGEKAMPGEQVFAGRKTWGQFRIENYEYDLARKIEELTLPIEDRYITLKGVIGLRTEGNITECICDMAIHHTENPE